MQIRLISIAAASERPLGGMQITGLICITRGGAPPSCIILKPAVGVAHQLHPGGAMTSASCGRDFLWETEMDRGRSWGDDIIRHHVRSRPLPAHKPRACQSTWRPSCTS
jgi:hypothetical protein